MSSQALLSMMSVKLVPGARELGITSVVSVYALQLASGKPNAPIHWNSNYSHDRDRCMLFWRSGGAKSFFPEAKMAHADVLATTLRAEKTCGAISGRVRAGAMSFAPISTDDRNRKIHTYVSQRAFTGHPLATFGSQAGVEVPNSQKLLQHMRKNGSENHAARNPSASAAILTEPAEIYFGWEVDHHRG